MTIIEKLRELRREWDLERVSRPDLYGDPPKAVWKRRNAIRISLDEIEASLTRYERLFRVYAASKAGIYGKRRRP